VPSLARVGQKKSPWVQYTIVRRGRGVKKKSLGGRHKGGKEEASPGKKKAGVEA